MGLAPYGKPLRLDELRRLVTLRPDGSYRLNLGFFRHHSDGVAMTWNDSEPVVESDLYSDRLKDLLGPARVPGEPITSHHQDIAASLRFADQQCVDPILRQRVLGTLLCNRDELSIIARKRQYGRINQPVMDDDLSALDETRCAQG